MSLDSWRQPVALSDAGLWALQFAALPDDVAGLAKVLQGLLKPPQCPAFGRECTPRTPLGATMVSNEGACAAYYQYGQG